jgi:pimeloyl-ACP methyl ester carboxylesterase
MTRSAMERAEAGRAAGAAYRERDISVRGTQVRVLEAGSGDALLYLHGSGDTGQWTPALSALAERYAVCRPDHPGFNASADSQDIDSVHDLAFFYLDLLDEMGVDRLVLVGSSLGGWLAADLATIEPRRVSKLVLIGAAGIRADIPAPDVFLLSPAEMARLTYHTAEARSVAQRQAEQMAEDSGRLERYLRNRSALAHLGWNPYLHDPALPRRLHRITAPTLIMWGAHDQVLPVGYAHRWAGLLAHAQLAIIGEAGHLPLAEQADAALAALLAFCGES